MKPEHGSHNFFNNRYYPIPASHVKQFVARNAVLPCGTQAHEGLR
jgi:hypothetical protein